MSDFRAAVVAIGLGLLAACAHSAANSSSASCAEAIYTTPANAPPKPVRAVRVGPAVFNSLANLTTRRGIDRPSGRLPFYTVKSPLTILAQPRRSVTISIVGGKDAALLYSRRWQRRLAAWHYSFARVTRSIRLQLCRDSRGTSFNTQYAGGFLLRRLGCVTIEVQAVGETRTYRATVPIGVRTCYE